jgi:HK97 gp10 family phage protein
MSVTIKMITPFSARRITTAVHHAVADVVREATQEAGLEAVLNAPLKTGELAGSMTHHTDEETLTGTIEFSAPHAPFVERGTRFQEAQPFLEPAILHQERTLEKRLKRAVEGAR